MNFAGCKRKSKLVCRKGSLLLTVSIFMAVIAIFAESFLLWFQARERVSVRTSAKTEIANLANVLKMALSSRTGCDLNRTSGGFGQTLAQLDQLSLSKKIQVLSPVAGEAALAKVGQQIDHLHITEIYFSPPSERFKIPNENTYIANLYIQTKDPFSIGLSPIVIPFYLVTNAAGDLTSCFATTYADSKAEIPVTIENFLCETIGGSNLIYSPKEHTCIAGSTVISGN